MYLLRDLLRPSWNKIYIMVRMRLFKKKKKNSNIISKNPQK